MRLQVTLVSGDKCPLVTCGEGTLGMALERGTLCVPGAVTRLERGVRVFISSQFFRGQLGCF